MVSYKRFRHYLIENEISRDYMIDIVGISSTTYTKLMQDKPVRMEVLERICLHFKIGIEEVLEIKEG